MQNHVWVVLGVFFFSGVSNVKAQEGGRPSLQEQCNELESLADASCNYIGRATCFREEISNQSARRRLPRWDLVRHEDLELLEPALLRVISAIPSAPVIEFPVSKVRFDLVGRCYLERLTHCRSLSQDNLNGINEFLTARRPYLNSSSSAPYAAVPGEISAALPGLLNGITEQLEDTQRSADRMLNDLIDGKWRASHGQIRNHHACRDVASEVSRLSTLITSLTATRVFEGLVPTRRQTPMNQAPVASFTPVQTAAPILQSCDAADQESATHRFAALLRAAHAVSLAEMRDDQNRAELQAAQFVIDVTASILLAAWRPMIRAAEPVVQAVEAASSGPRLRLIQGGRAGIPRVHDFRRVAARTGAAAAAASRSAAAQAPSLEVVMQQPNGNLVAQRPNGSRCQIERAAFCSALQRAGFESAGACGR